MFGQAASLRVVDGSHVIGTRSTSRNSVSCGVQPHRWCTGDPATRSMPRRESNVNELMAVSSATHYMPHALMIAQPGQTYASVFADTETSWQTPNYGELSLWEQTLHHHEVYERPAVAPLRRLPAFGYPRADEPPNLLRASYRARYYAYSESNSNGAWDDWGARRGNPVGDAGRVNRIGRDAAQVEARAKADSRAVCAGDLRVVSVEVQDAEHMQRASDLRIMWDADSIPYASTVLSAILGELGEPQVQSLEVFASGATAASLCGPSSSLERPVGGLLRVDLNRPHSTSAAPAATCMIAHTLQVAHSSSDAQFILVSSDPNAIPGLTTLRMLGRQAVAVTAATAAATPAAALAPAGTPRIHLTLSHSKQAASPAASTPPSTADGAESRPADSNGAAANGAAAAVQNRSCTASNGSAAEAEQTDPVPEAMQLLLMQPLSVLCAVLSSCLDRVSEYNIRRFQHKLQHESGTFCASPDFPHEIVAVLSLRSALVAGFAEESTWFVGEKAAVLGALLRYNCYNLYAQIGGLAIDSETPRLPRMRSAAGRRMAADRSNAAAGKALLTAMLRLAHDYSATGPLPSGTPGSAPAAITAGTAAGTDATPHTADPRWLLFASCLDRVAVSWYGRLKEHILLDLFSHIDTENFPLVLCKCDNFRRSMISMVASAVVPNRQKAAIAEALLRYGDPHLFAQMGYMAKNPAAAALPESIRLSQHINDEMSLQREGEQLLQRLSTS
eukprot:jgi/Ulvmu1/2223/UM013_0070.1